MTELVLFAGPTIARARAIRPDLAFDGIELRPPVQRGDIPRLVRESAAPSAIAIVDGKFHQVLAVGHMEIRDAIAAGWTVWGLSSLGAIRAREMHHLGMKGYGRVFEMYCGPGDFRDDEVTLLHEPEPPYRELSEPLVHLRLALRGAAERGVLEGGLVDELVGALEGMYFGDRTLAWLKTQLRERGEPDAFADIAASLDRYRIKSLDLVAFVEGRAWAR